MYVKVLQQKPLHYMESKTQNLPGRDGHKLYLKKKYIKREGGRKKEGEREREKITLRITCT